MKKWSKRTISAILVCLLLLALLPTGVLAADTGEDWADEYIQTAVDNGWIQADAEARLTRVEFAKILWRTLGSPAAAEECPFKDVTETTEKKAVTALYEAKVTYGTGGGLFTPDTYLIRQEAITMLARAFDLKAEDAGAAEGFADWADVEDWAQDAMAAAVEKGIVIGVGNNRLAPNQILTLGEIAKLIVLCAEMTKEEISADYAIDSIETIGFVDNDGAKVAAIAIKYNVDLTGADIDVSDYEINDYGMEQGDGKCEIGSDPGVALKAYVNDEAAISAEGGSGTGSYVIIEVNTEYQLGSVPGYLQAMIASVLQTGTIQTATLRITPSTEAVVNYTEKEVEGRNGTQIQRTVNDGAYVLTNITGFQLFTKEDGTAFHATDCFEEATGELIDVDLPYALYVPEDYDAGKQYALVLQIHDAGALSDDPMVTLTESQGSANFASAEVQQIAKDQGLAGLIVVAPQINSDLRSTRDNWSLSAAVPATWQLLDYLTETYSIDMDHIYGTGQSMGGMQVVAMAAQRDNYFAGLWANGCQWGNNYNLEEPYNGAAYYAAPADGEMIWTVDADGNECDYRNWYYMISDDNVLITNCVGDAFSTKTWTELAFLYKDLAGATDIPKETWDPLTLSTDAQNAIVRQLMKRTTDRGFCWTAFEGGNHMATWIYSHGVFAHYEWLLTQSRDAEMEREKLPLDRPFEAAEEQIQTADRYIAKDADGNDVYFVTGKAGAGTADYNSSWLKMGNSVIKEPNWKPTEEQQTISADDAIESVKTIGFIDTDGAKLSAIVVEYNVDLAGADLDVDSYEIMDYGIEKGDSFCELGSDPGEAVKVYVNNEAAISAEGGSGAGKYVIIEVNTDYQMGSVASTWLNALYADVLQTATIQATNYIITPGTEKVTNYTVTEIQGKNGQEFYNYANEGAYSIPELDVFEIHDETDPFHATNCFDEATGEYTDVDLSYALYVPEDYDPDLEYALVVHIGDAGALGTNPWISLTKSQGPINFTKDEVQQIVKDQGLGGVIVLVPQIDDPLRSTRDNWSLSAAVPATWQLLDTITETYSIDMNRIYGTGQSMGGMQVVAMAAQRDNYFAGIWENGCQWGSNHNLEDEYEGAVYYEMPADGTLIWTVDSDGNEVNYRNWHYLISDDNILITNCTGDSFSTSIWQELAYVYSDLAGVEIPKTEWNPLTLTHEEQSEFMNSFLAEQQDYDRGFYWTALSGGGHMGTWIYSHGVFANYQWLLTQTRESEMQRDKLDLDKPFEFADEQIETADRLIGQGTDGNNVYYATGKFGSGTADFNSVLLGKNGRGVARAPGVMHDKVISADDAIVGVKTIGFVDTDGAKVSAVVIEYNVDLTGADIDISDYEISDYGIAQGDGKCELGSDPGVALKAYVNDEAAVSAEGGSGTGKYVIIEVNTDYQLTGGASSYKEAMYAGVSQVASITAAGYTITPSTQAVVNYEVIEETTFKGTSYYNNALDGTYTIQDLDKFQLFTKEDGTAFHATHCFDEATGEYSDVDLPYALYVPEDYDASQKYALVLQIHDASHLGDDPLITLTEAQGCVNFASEEVQQIVKDQGLAGLIVVAPQINSDMRSTRDNWSLSAAVPATWQLLDSITATYNVDMNRIYATGQSMGGMQAIAMAAQRDNYFAAVWENGCQWGNNYNLEDPYNGNTYYAAPADGELIWTKDADGNECDYRNWYYMISDDNILITNCIGDTLSSRIWQEFAYLYSDLLGVTIPKTTLNPLAESKDEPNAAITNLVSQPYELGIYWTAMEGGSHGSTWIYSHSLIANYQWLLTQTRESEMARDKQDLNKPFELADEQLLTDDRIVQYADEEAGKDLVYYVTGKFGSGTIGYNTTVFGGKVAEGGEVLRVPGWKPAE